MDRYRKAWNAIEMEKRLRQARDAIDQLLGAPAVPRKDNSGRILRTVLADAVYRGELMSTPDGMPRSSMAPALEAARERQCKACKGTGAEPDKEGRWCKACKGSGHTYVDAGEQAGGLRFSPEDPLARKQGHGYKESSVEAAVIHLIEDKTCPRCGGSGNIARQRVVDDGSEETWVETCRRCDGHGQLYSDPIAEAVDAMCTSVYELVGHSMIIRKRAAVVFHAADQLKSDSVPYHCDACHRDVYGGTADPIRHGLDKDCREKFRWWRREGGPNRTNDEGLDRRRFCGQAEKHAGHHPAACEACDQEKELRRDAGEDWRLEGVDGRAK